MKPTLRVITMIGGFDLIGELMGDRLEHPCILQVGPGSTITLRPMAKGSAVLGGDSITLNMRSALWIGEPTQALCTAWQASRGGILVPSVANSNIPADHRVQ